jgi:hypothetical protein
MGVKHMHDARNALSISASYNMQGARSVKKNNRETPEKRHHVCWIYVDKMCVDEARQRCVEERE